LCKDVGGTDSRRIYFHTDTNDVLLRRIPCTMFKDVAVKEKRRFAQVKKDAQRDGEVILFDEGNRHP